MPLPIGDNRAPSVPRLPAPAPVEEPDFFETWGLQVDVRRQDNLDAQQHDEMDIYEPVIERLIDLGVDERSLYRQSRYSSVQGGPNPVAIWQAIRAQQQKGKLKDLSMHRDEWEMEQIAKRREAIARGGERAALGNPVARFLGDVAGGMADPVNAITALLPLGGSTIWRAAGREALFGMTIEAVQQPLVQGQRRAQGRPEMTGEEMAANVGFVGAGGFLFSLGTQAAGKGAQRLWEKSVEASWDRLPKRLQDRWAGRATMTQAESDEFIADVAEVVLGDAAEIGTARDAIETLRAGARMERANPFAESGEAALAHDALLGQTMSSVLRNLPEAARRDRTRLPPRPSLQSGTAMNSGTVGAPWDVQGETSFAAVKAAIRVPESAGNDQATNALGSSASGRYQFISSTFQSLYRKEFGASEAEAARVWNSQRRFDVAVQERLMDRLLTDNAAVLRRAGVTVDTGNLYVAHFAGAERAAKLAKADPSEPVSRYFSATEIRQNPSYLGGGKTVGEALGIIRGKVGGGGVISVRSDINEQGYRQQLQQEINALEAEMRTLEAQRASEAQGEALDAEGLPIARDDIDMPAPRQFDDAMGPDEAPFPPPPPPPPPLGRAQADQLSALVDDRTRSLNQVEALADEIGAPPEAVRAALMEMAGRGRITMVGNPKSKRYGQFMRKPEIPDGPEDVLEFIARNGGIRDDEGHALGLVGVSAEERAAFNTREQQRISDGRKAKGRRDWQTMTRRNGPLLRHEGRSIDEVGEALWEAGYLRGDTPTGRPTEADVLAYLDDRIGSGKPAFTLEEQARTLDAVQEWGDAPELSDVDIEVIAFRKAWEEFGNDPADLDEALIWRAAELYEQGDAFLPQHALAMAIREDYELTRRMLIEESMAEEYGARYDPFDWQQQQELERRYQADGGGGEGQQGQPGDPRQGGAEREAAARAGKDAGPALAEVPPDIRSPMRMADSEAVAMQADDLLHDARAALTRLADMGGDARSPFDMSVSRAVSNLARTQDAERAAASSAPPAARSEVDPAIAERQRQETQLRAEAPLRGENVTGAAQDGTMGAPLFDAVNQPTFRFDVEGEERAMKELLADIDAEEAELKAIRDCL